MEKVKQLIVYALSHEAFAPYGRILVPRNEELPEVTVPNTFDFYVIYKVFSSGWQLGYLTVTNTYVERLECHRTTPEAFVPLPLSGEAVLVVCNDPSDESSLLAFRITEPVVLKVGVWHNVLYLAGAPAILVVENPDVTDSFYQLSHPLRVIENRGDAL